ncbi:hypothetical protein GOY11_03270 (plasmid) [Pseudomonas aeruginosa]|nr:hypothetical protein [Pseudomonas aeruginosa]MCH0740542.1 hypothetical protein [Pseudomonas aeruginosa]
MQEFATQVVDLLNGLIWGKILIWLLVGCGLYFTVRLGLIQFRKRPLSTVLTLRL